MSKQKNKIKAFTNNKEIKEFLDRNSDIFQSEIKIDIEYKKNILDFVDNQDDLKEESDDMADYIPNPVPLGLSFADVVLVFLIQAIFTGIQADVYNNIFKPGLLKLWKKIYKFAKDRDYIRIDTGQTESIKIGFLIPIKLNKKELECALNDLPRIRKEILKLNQLAKIDSSLVIVRFVNLSNRKWEVEF